MPTRLSLPADLFSLRSIWMRRISSAFFFRASAWASFSRLTRSFSSSARLAFCSACCFMNFLRKGTLANSCAMAKMLLAIQ